VDNVVGTTCFVPDCNTALGCRQAVRPCHASLCSASRDRTPRPTACWCYRSRGTRSQPLAVAMPRSWGPACWSPRSCARQWAGT
jgi:hypothetical protein